MATPQAEHRACQPFLRATAVEHRDFHNVPAPGDLGCGKINVRRPDREASWHHGMGETAVQRVHSLWTALWTTSCDQ